MAISFKGAHCPPDIILTGVRWSLASPRSTRHVEDLLFERRVETGDEGLTEAEQFYALAA